MVLNVLACEIIKNIMFKYLYYIGASLQRMKKHLLGLTLKSNTISRDLLKCFKDLIQLISSKINKISNSYEFD